MTSLTSRQLERDRGESARRADRNVQRRLTCRPGSRPATAPRPSRPPPRRRCIRRRGCKGDVESRRALGAERRRPPVRQVKSSVMVAVAVARRSLGDRLAQPGTARRRAGRGRCRPSRRRRPSRDASWSRASSGRPRARRQASSPTAVGSGRAGATRSRPATRGARSSPPGAGSVAWRTWARTSKFGSSTHAGRRSPCTRCSERRQWKRGSAAKRSPEQRAQLLERWRGRRCRPADRRSARRRCASSRPHRPARARGTSHRVGLGARWSPTCANRKWWLAGRGSVAPRASAAHNYCSRSGAATGAREFFARVAGRSLATRSPVLER